MRKRVVLPITFLALALRWAVPVSPGYGAKHDDELMLKLAENIAEGKWLGEYSDMGHLTLAKGAGYPLFLAFAKELPWSVSVTTHALTLLGFMMVLVTFGKLGWPRWVLETTFALVAFFPPFFGDQYSRIYREPLLVALVCLGFGLASISAKWLTSTSKDGHRPLYGLGFVLPIAGWGITISWMAATKPTWYPAVLSQIGLFLFVFANLRAREGRVHERTISLGRKIRMTITNRRFLISISTFFAGLISVFGSISVLNYQHYGFFGVDSFSSGSFPAAINTLASIKSGEQRDYVVVTAAQRSEMYRVSETARQLEPFLELSWGYGWRGSACSAPVQICDEAAAWFPWELRDAVEQAGLANSAREFERTFATIESDLKTACSRGTIECGGSGIAPAILPISRISPRLILDSTAIGIHFLLEPRIPNVSRGPYIVPNDESFNLWQTNIRGLPELDPNVYLGESPYLGRLLRLLEAVYQSLWIPLVFVSVAGLLFSMKHSNLRHYWLLPLVILAGALGEIGGLSLAEASSGGFMDAGKWLYLLPTYIYVLHLLIFGLCGVQTFLVRVMGSEANKPGVLG